MEGLDNFSGIVVLLLVLSEVIVWCVIFGVEVLVVIISNVVIIVIFFINK